MKVMAKVHYETTGWNRTVNRENFIGYYVPGLDPYSTALSGTSAAFVMDSVPGNTGIVMVIITYIYTVLHYHPFN